MSPHTTSPRPPPSPPAAPPAGSVRRVRLIDLVLSGALQLGVAPSAGPRR